MTTIVVISFSSDGKSGDNMQVRNMNKHIFQLMMDLKYIQPITNNMGLLGKEIVRAK